MNTYQVSKKQIFASSSKTFFNSSRFFPREIRADVFTLYSWVRIPDDLVDKKEPAAKTYLRFKLDTYKALKGKQVNNEIITDFVELMYRKIIPVSFIDAFFGAMDSDLRGRKYNTLDDTLAYVNGSAEVIGLMMSRILNLDSKTDQAAKLLGRAFQFINFIRDIDEDNELGRSYFPQQELEKFGLRDLRQQTVAANQRGFKKFIDLQISRYYRWLKQAEKSFLLLPKNYRIPIKTASDMYCWTAETIKKNPLLIYATKIKPSTIKVVATGMLNYLQIHLKES